VTDNEALGGARDDRTGNPAPEEAGENTRDTITSQDQGLKPSGGMQTGLSEERDQEGTDRPQPPSDTARPR
jgi:hypothetical protein